MLRSFWKNNNLLNTRQCVLRLATFTGRPFSAAPIRTQSNNSNTTEPNDAAATNHSDDPISPAENASREDATMSEANVRSDWDTTPISELQSRTVKRLSSEDENGTPNGTCGRTSSNE
ncbi:hypothetical protein SJAG_04212 [Schizosaccharomyces japonicus yFS275]|uniref:Uncharacterized protein n=1 Tax=Schizosaccharomyces japonicus (strain yFS275 / FY16936) TaxID=402676 RepID=B6K684_SCHJY|nr:hypothetical protein SJAG_04212 [Schizosaccharomyces japonicus yFS275]EEB09038.1 hypothetical protein SJAG_04212 [Schizosaccharomyces japonicus yFS275]